MFYGDYGRLILRWTFLFPTSLLSTPFGLLQPPSRMKSWRSCPPTSHPVQTTLLCCFPVGRHLAVPLRIMQHHLRHAIPGGSIQVLPLSDCIPVDFFLNHWVWVDLFTESILLVPLEARVLDVKRTEAQLACDRDPGSTHLAGKMSHYALLLKYSISLASPSAPGATINASSMNGTGRLATMPAREPRRPLNGRLCSLVNYVFLIPL